MRRLSGPTRAIRRGLIGIGQGRPGQFHQLTIKLDPVRSIAGILDCARPLLRRTPMIAPHEAADQGVGRLQQPRAITRTASQRRLLSLGSCMSAAVTVLSSRTTLPVSTFSCRALASRMGLIASHVSARMALIVMCSTDFFGVHDSGSRAKARKEAESYR